MMYFWDELGNRILTNPNKLNARSAVMNGYMGMLCVDTTCTYDKQRYGSFNGSMGSWSHIPFAGFPTGFIFALTQKGLPELNDQLVYYAGRLIEPVQDHKLHIPDGSYVRLKDGRWYLVDMGYNQIDLVDVPKDIRLHAFLMTGEN